MNKLIIKTKLSQFQPVEDIVKLTEQLKKDGHTSYGLSLAVESCFHNGNVDLTLNLLRVLKEQGEPVRNHYFWPPLAVVGKSGNLNRTLFCFYSLFNVVTG